LGWFKISVWGKEIDGDAWLLVQHMDGDVVFQKQVLEMLEPLYRTGETDPSNYAHLYDRVAWNERRPQRYGTQGRCAAKLRWEPKPLEEPARVDERRKTVGLEPMKSYRRRMSALCSAAD